jgi:uridylate kinase
MVRRALLKISGEALSGRAGTGFDFSVLSTIVGAIKDIQNSGQELALVAGGGNFIRGGQIPSQHLERTTADQAGMLATVMNALVLRDMLQQQGARAAVFTAAPMPGVATVFEADRVRRIMADGTIAVLAGGTGNPYFTTDTAAVLRALEIKAELLIKATNVDGVFSADPRTDPGAIRYSEITFQAAVEKRLKVMDLTAMTLCWENNLPCVVLNLNPAENIKRALAGESIGTRVCA